VENISAGEGTIYMEHSHNTHTGRDRACGWRIVRGFVVSGAATLVAIPGSI